MKQFLETQVALYLTNNTKISKEVLISLISKYYGFGAAALIEKIESK